MSINNTDPNLVQNLAGALGSTLISDKNIRLQAEQYIKEVSKHNSF